MDIWTIALGVFVGLAIYKLTEAGLILAYAWIVTR